MAENESLSATQQRVIALLVAGSTVAEAAQACRVNESTIYRWKRDSAFREALHVGHQGVLDQALVKLIRVTGHAIDTLTRNMLNDSGAPAAIRGVQVRAATTLLEQSLAIHKMQELENKVRELEALIKERAV